MKCGSVLRSMFCGRPSVSSLSACPFMRTLWTYGWADGVICAWTDTHKVHNCALFAPTVFLRDYTLSIRIVYRSVSGRVPIIGVHWCPVPSALDHAPPLYERFDVSAKCFYCSTIAGTHWLDHLPSWLFLCECNHLVRTRSKRKINVSDCANHWEDSPKTRKIIWSTRNVNWLSSLTAKVLFIRHVCTYVCISYVCGETTFSMCYSPGKYILTAIPGWN